ncbi:PTS system, fructose-specific enzyme II, A component [Deferribacter desulfuricans SSM1]|uniref:PTS system, fructose-specific enzyme II, A component n=1 Tax=Deferribacter desulfuricans (strain DSM 14783 / JCM 11476 / NBRC 101012 / SSM1) TaxID=639282 RepID=D3PD43_DEFDS|nr:PTS sugar transporter subunit IIA [Deferribacter desulfuricans]BAI80516.1 PTS system, fructose-specific enzyme II, A component [Deferribacter desulfuricans SSM1]
MKISDYVDEKHVIFIDEKLDKDALLKLFAEKFRELDAISDSQAIFEALYERELLSSTAVGEEVAIPHAKLANLDDIKMIIAISKVGQDFQAVDNLPVKLFFVVIAPANKMQLHLKALARISRLVKMTDFKKRALEQDSAKKVIDILVEEENKL